MAIDFRDDGIASPQSNVSCIVWRLSNIRTGGDATARVPNCRRKRVVSSLTYRTDPIPLKRRHHESKPPN